MIGNQAQPSLALLSFCSQMALQPYGHLICTPISLLASTTYLNAFFQDLNAIFTHENVAQMMEASHHLYAEIFSKKLNGTPLMIQELYAWIPKADFAMTEAAGLILPAAHEKDSESRRIAGKHDDEGPEIDLEIISLVQLIENTLIMARNKRKRFCIIVTAKGHTISYLCSERGELLVFDSLPAVRSGPITRQQCRIFGTAIDQKLRRNTHENQALTAYIKNASLSLDCPMVHVPPPVVKILMAFYIHLLDYASSKQLFLSAGQAPTSWIQQFLPCEESAAGQCLLFSCFSNVLLLHLPSFVWRGKVHVLQSASLLEHILHYYFILAALLLAISSTVVKADKVLSTQMALYFLWHIIHKCRESKRLSLFKKRTLCTLFPMFMESFAFCFVLVILPLFWLANKDAEGKTSTTTTTSSSFSEWIAHFMHINSFLVLCDLGSLVFRCLEVVVYPCLL